MNIRLKKEKALKVNKAIGLLKIQENNFGIKIINQ